MKTKKEVINVQYKSCGYEWKAENKEISVSYVYPGGVLRVLHSTRHSTHLSRAMLRHPGGTRGLSGMASMTKGATGINYPSI